MEVNQIQNSRLKENLANAAINILVQNNLVTEDDFKGLGVDIGYLFAKENGELESLFKLMFSGKTFFFALQEGKLMFLEIDDQMYDQTIANMKNMYPCLLSDELPDAPIGDLNPSIVIERRRGLEWVVSDETDWYEMDMPA